MRWARDDGSGRRMDPERQMRVSKKYRCAERLVKRERVDGAGVTRIEKRAVALRALAGQR